MSLRLTAPSNALSFARNCSRNHIPHGANFPIAKQIIPTIGAIPRRKRSQTPSSHNANRYLHTSSARLKINKSSIVSAKTEQFDLSELQAGIERAIEKLKNDLSKLRPGGRFNPELLENLAVPLDKKSKQVERLRELAQVVSRGGRTVVIHVGEKDYIKPITSSIQNSGLNLTPQPDPEEALQLNISIPPPTKESRLAVLETAQKAGKVAQGMVGDARGAQKKKFKAMFVAERVRKDEQVKAEKEMEKVVEKGKREVEDILKGARKALESS